MNRAPGSGGSGLGGGGSRPPGRPGPAPGEVVGVFGGGGAKAAAHAGAFRALEEAGLVPGRYVGTSMGAAFAAMFAAGLSSREALDRVSAVAGREVVRTERISLVKGLWARHLLKPGPFREALAQLVPVRRFDALRVPLTVTATDLESGELVLFGAEGRDVPLLDALYASAALPLYFPPLELEGRRYADGGLRAVLPLEPAARLPVALVAAVDVGPGFDEPPAAGGSGLPPLVELHNEVTGILMAGQTALAVAAWRADPARPRLLYIRPRLERGATFKVDQVRRYAELGYAAARDALAGLQSEAR